VISKRCIQILFMSVLFFIIILVIRIITTVRFVYVTRIIHINFIFMQDVGPFEKLRKVT